MRWREHEGQVAGHRLAWRRSGAGPPLLYLHDAGADTLASPALARLGGDHDLVVLDLPGYGRSGPPTGLTRAEDVAEVLRTLLDHLGWARATVAGCSLGGWFGLELAIAAPERVHALVLAAAAGLQVPPDYLFALFADGSAAAGTEQRIARALRAALPADEQDLEAMAPALAAATIGPWVQALAAAAATSWHPATANPAMLGRLHRLACPTTILWGEHDALIPLAHGRLLAAGIPQALLVVVAGGGHLVPLERPEILVAAVRGRTGST